MRSLPERIADVLAGSLTLVILVILYAPVLISGLFSVCDVKDGHIQWSSFTLVHYRDLWSIPSLVDALRNTAIVASIAVSLATLLAIALAVYVEWSGAIGRRLLEVAIYLPFLLPPIVTGLALLVASAELDVSRGLTTIIIGHLAFVLAVAYRLVLTRLQVLPHSLLEASRDLGANQFQTLRYIVLPHLLPAVVTGAVLALTLSFDETLISVFLAGDRMTLPLRLWAMVRVGFTPEINALVTIVLAVSLALAAFAAFRLKIGNQSNTE